MTAEDNEALLEQVKDALLASGDEVTTDIDRSASEDEKEAAKKAEDEKKEKEAAASKKAKKSRKAEDDDKKEDGKPENIANDKDDPPMSAKSQIGALKAALEEKQVQIDKITDALSFAQAKPLVDKMLTARKNSGMSDEQLKSFSDNLYGKSYDDIKQRYDEDAVFLNSQSTASTITPLEEIPFNAGLTASSDNKTLEEMLDAN